MFRLLVLCTIVIFVEPHRRQCRTNPPFNGNRCPGNTGRTSLETMLQSVERDYIEQEEKFLQFCRENSPAITGEMYGTDSYYLTYDLPEARNARITVRIKHKFLLTTVTETDDIIFQDVKVLPDIANTEAAVWTFDQQTLKITIPYKVALGETVGKTCGSVNNFDIDVRAGRSSGFNYRSQDSNHDNDYPTQRSSRFNLRSQDSTENEHDNPAARPSGSNYRSQGSSHGYDGASARSSRTHFRSQDSTENGYDNPTARSSGSNYRSQDSRHGNDRPAARYSKFNLRSQDSTENMYDSRFLGSNYRSQGSKQNVYDEPAARSSGFQRSQDSTENNY